MIVSSCAFKGVGSIITPWKLVRHVPDANGFSNDFRMRKRVRVDLGKQRRMPAEWKRGVVRTRRNEFLAYIANPLMFLLEKLKDEGDDHDDRRSPDKNGDNDILKFLFHENQHSLPFHKATTRCRICMRSSMTAPTGHR